MQNRNIIIVSILALSGLLLLIVIITALVRTSNQKSETQPTPTVAILDSNTFRTDSQKIKATITQDVPRKIQDAPTLAPNQGYGTDPNAVTTKASTDEIAKLGLHVPYSADIQLQGGKTITVHVTSLDRQIHPWTLNVDVFGVDFNVPRSDSQYEVERHAFLVGANNIFNWIKSKNADPSKIIIIWSDKQFAQNRAQSWLTEQ